MINRGLRGVVLAALAGLCGGCGSLGHGTVSADRAGYSDAVATSWKEQMLLNLVKLKYADVPVFLDVSSIIASYQFEARASGSLDWDVENARSEMLGIGGSYQDKPTITYVPLGGEKFTRSMLTPIPPATIFALVQGGWPVAGVLGIAVRSINGVRNRSLAMNACAADPEWLQLIESWAAIQASGAADMRIHRTDVGEVVVIAFVDSTDPAVVEHGRRVRRILRVAPDIGQFTLSFGAHSTQPGEIAVLSRSLFEVLLEIAATVEVSQDDVDSGRVNPLSDPGAEPLIAVRSSASRPDGAAVATRYRDRWYYIPDDDVRSKSRLMTLFFIIAMLESGGRPASGPTLTISN